MWSKGSSEINGVSNFEFEEVIKLNYERNLKAFQ